MAEELKDKGTPEPSKRRRTLRSTLRDSFFELRPETKPWKEYLEEKFHGLRFKRWVILSLTALVLISLAALLTHKIEKRTSDLTIAATNGFFSRLLVATNDFFSRSNSFLLGRIDQNAKDIGRLEKTITDNKADSNAEIQKLTTEKLAAENQLTFIHALPEKVARTYLINV